MSIAELKANLHEGIQNIDDEELLLIIKELIEENYNFSGEIILTKKQEQALAEAHADIEAGRVYSEEEVKNHIDAWLKEKG